ncbi:ATP-binding protein [Patescibacteria group bacterium]|nr:ATP-binding protein [Patescibacteria group bacterium]MBU4000347.1 ATP-binding protein [Patescibacteria group bacterium]MBU4056735.1 ATP-binding protein [Patescibacteria group bacterium]MBU4368161.1 ATP-binding protein [Patescibacteria group bacterium]
MLVNRELINQIKPFLDKKEYLAIIGPRQSGKTTLLDLIKEYLINEKAVKPENIKIVTFENRILLNQFDSDPIAFINSYKNIGKANNVFYLMLDEFQYSIEGGQKLKLIFDTVKDVKIIITGSSSLDIKAQVGKYMVGRILTFSLYPLNFGEFLAVKNERLQRMYKDKNKKLTDWVLAEEAGEYFKDAEDVFASEFLKLFEEYAIWGGYPRVVLSESADEKLKVLNDIQNNYILKDIKGLLELATDKNLLLMSQFLAAQIGNILVYKNLSQASQLDYRKTIDHLRILQETFIVDFARPYFKNKQKELSKNPKVYFFDLGFRNSLIGNAVSFERRSDVGAMAENVVYLKLKSFLNGFGGINFWRSKIGAEVDFIVNLKGEIFPIEVKFSSFEKPTVSRSFISFVKSFKPKKGLVLTKNFQGMIEKDGCKILFYPIYYF